MVGSLVLIAKPLQDFVRCWHGTLESAVTRYLMAVQRNHGALPYLGQSCREDGTSEHICTTRGAFRALAAHAVSDSDPERTRFVRVSVAEAQHSERHLGRELSDNI